MGSSFREAHLPQDFLLAPFLKTAVHRLVVGVILGKHVSLGAGVENPQHGLQDTSRGYRLAPRTPLENVLLRKMRSNSFPLGIRQADGHALFYV